MKRMLDFAIFFSVLALLAVASCAPIQWPASSAYSDKAQSGLRPERDPSVKKQEKPAEKKSESSTHERGHHANGGHQGHASHHPHGMAYATNLPRDKADIPDFARPRWVPADFSAWPASENLDVHYSSYRDTTRPELAVAAVMTLSFQNAQKNLLVHAIWEVGDEIRSTFLKTSEPVCVKPVVTHNGERLGLDGFYKRLKTQAAKLSPPNAKTP